MTFPPVLQTNLATVGSILAGMGALSLLETAIPLHARGRWHRVHLGPNLALTFITFAMNFLFNGALLLMLGRLQTGGFGLLRWASLDPLAAGAIAVVVLDFSYYLAHVAMHKVPAFWTVHRVHHSDPAVDVTTTIRQHPLEGVLRYAVLAAFAGALGVGLGAFMVYRVWSALNGLLEHANLRLPRKLDRALSWVTTWPYFHKVHHSRDARETDTNYGNIFSGFDRLFGTHTPSWRGETVVCGLDGMEGPSLQTTLGLLVMGFRDPAGPVERSLEPEPGALAAHPAEPAPAPPHGTPA